MNRKEILEAAMSYVTVDREAQYGNPEDNFRIIADLWNTYIEGISDGIVCALTPEDVAIMMALLKIGRIATGQKKDDNYADLAGYAACAGEIATKKDIKKTCCSCRFDDDDPMGEYEPCFSCEEYNNWELKHLA